MIRPTLSIASRLYPVQGCTIERSLGAAVGTFRVQGPVAGQIPRAGERVVLGVSADEGPTENLVVGYVDEVGGQVDAVDRTWSIQGRDLTADVVDGRRLESPSSWKDASLLQIARDLVLPYGIQVLDFVGADQMFVSRLASQPAETTYATLERAARQFGVLIGTEPRGALALGATEIGPASVPLRSGPGGNVVSWAWRSSHATRFRRVRVLGQNTGGFGQLVEGGGVPEAIAIDPEVRGQRETEIVAQGQVLQEDCERLAAWHIAVARARAFTLEVRLASWRQGTTGRVWRPGLRVPVWLDEIEEEAQMLVDSVSLDFGADGEQANLSLVRPGSYDQDPSRGVDTEPLGFGALL